MSDREEMYCSRDHQSIQSNCVVTDNEQELKCRIIQFKFCMFSKIDSHCLRLHGIDILNKQRLITDASTHDAIDYLNIQMKSLGRNKYSRKFYI